VVVDFPAAAAVAVAAAVGSLIVFIFQGLNFLAKQTTTVFISTQIVFQAHNFTKIGIIKHFFFGVDFCNLIDLQLLPNDYYHHT
jgi:hypothetical protein